MPTAQVQLPDGKKAQIEFTDQAQLDATINDLVKAHPAPRAAPASTPPPQPAAPPESPLGRAEDAVSEAIGEPALHMATGALSGAAGGVAGLARGGAAAAGTLAGGGSAEEARRAFQEEGTHTIRDVEQAGTYQPRTKTGQRASEIVSTPFTLLQRGGEAAGRKAADLTGSPAVGAVVDTAVQALPGAIAPMARGVTSLARSARVPPAAAAETLQASGAPRSPPSEIGAGDVPRGTSSGSAPQPPGAGQPSGGGADTSSSTYEARARAYAGRIGLNWARLGAGTRKALQSIAQDATALDRLNPEAVKRQAHLESLRVPVRATRGQLERDPVQLRREAIASNTSEGQPIRDTDVGANRDLQANLEVLRGRLAGRRGNYAEAVSDQGEEIPGAVRSSTKPQTQVGEAVQGVVRDKAKWSKKAYQALYKKARETEPEAKAPIAPVSSLLESNPEIQHLGWVQGWLSKARQTLPKNEAGELPELTDVTLNELHDLRSKANDIARTGGKEGYYAAQVVKAVDEAMRNVPAGAAAWKRANEAFKTHQEEFADQGLVAKLANQKKGGADRQLALEKTWKQIATGSLEQIRQIKKTLIKGDNPAIRRQGAEAWRDLRAETVNRILEDARNVTGADETERAILTEAALRRSINRIPRQNLEELIGKGATRELYDILRARRITTRSPVGGRTTQSGTVPNALVLAEKVLKHIPGAKYVVGAKNALGELAQRGEAARTAKEANLTPLEQAVRDVQKTRPNFAKERREARYRELESLGPTLPSAPSQPTIGDAVRRPQP